MEQDKTAQEMWSENKKSLGKLFEKNMDAYVKVRQDRRMSLYAKLLSSGQKTTAQEIYG